jgi:hypothetical protein
MAVGKDRGCAEEVSHGSIAMLLGERTLLLPQCGPIAPEEKKRVEEEEVTVAAQKAKTGINEVIGEVVRMACEAVDPVGAKDLVAYQDPLYNKMDEAPEAKKEKGNGNLRRTDSAEKR